MQTATAADNLFAEMHDLFGAHAGFSQWREAADGLVKRREVRLCYVKTASALDYACRHLSAEEVDALRAAYSAGEAIIFTECLRVKRQPTTASALRIGQAEDAATHRLYPIARFTTLKPLYS